MPERVYTIMLLNITWSIIVYSIARHGLGK